MQRVMQVQDSKKDLADLVLGAHNEQDGGQSLKNLEVRLMLSIHLVCVSGY